MSYLWLTLETFYHNVIGHKCSALQSSEKAVIYIKINLETSQTTSVYDKRIGIGCLQQLHCS